MFLFFPRLRPENFCSFMSYTFVFLFFFYIFSIDVFVFFLYVYTHNLETSPPDLKLNEIILIFDKLILTLIIIIIKSAPQLNPRHN